MERKIDPHRGVLSTRVTYGLGGRVGMGVARCGVRPVYLVIAIAIRRTSNGPRVAPAPLRASPPPESAFGDTPMARIETNSDDRFQSKLDRNEF